MLPVLLIELLQSLDPGLERGLDLAPLLGDLGLECRDLGRQLLLRPLSVGLALGQLTRRSFVQTVD